MYYFPRALGKQLPNSAGVGNPVGEHPVNQDSWCYLIQKKPPPTASTVLTQQALPRGPPLDQIPAYRLNSRL